MRSGFSPVFSAVMVSICCSDALSPKQTKPQSLHPSDASIVLKRNDRYREASIFLHASVSCFACHSSIAPATLTMVSFLMRAELDPQISAHQRQNQPCVKSFRASRLRVSGFTISDAVVDKYFVLYWLNSILGFRGAGVRVPFKPYN